MLKCFPEYSREYFASHHPMNTLLFNSLTSLSIGMFIYSVAYSVVYLTHARTQCSVETSCYSFCPIIKLIGLWSLQVACENETRVIVSVHLFYYCVPEGKSQGGFSTFGLLMDHPLLKSSYSDDSAEKRSLRERCRVRVWPLGQCPTVHRGTKAHPSP